LSDHVLKVQEKQSLFIFHYAGHGQGANSPTGLDLVAPESPNSKLPAPRIPFTLVTNTLTEAGVDFLFILDCCEAGTLNRGVTSSNRDFLFACQDEEKTKGGLGAFTKNIDFYWRKLWKQKSWFLINEVTEAIRKDLFKDKSNCGPVTISRGTRPICIGQGDGQNETVSTISKFKATNVIISIHIEENHGDQTIADLAETLAKTNGVRILTVLPAQSSLLIIGMPLHIYNHLEPFCAINLLSLTEVEITTAGFNTFQQF